MINRSLPTSAKGIISAVLLLAAVVGCGETNALNRQAIQGTVTLDGQPIPIGTIRFSPELQTGVASGGPIANGSYSIRAVDGLPPGKYLVRIYATQPDNSSEEGMPPGLATEKPGIDLIPAQYNSSSELTCDVVDRNENRFVFDLKSGEHNP